MFLPKCSGLLLHGRWREFGQAALMYIDDGISGDAQKHIACNNSMLVQSDLRSPGWKPAQSKCY